MRYIAKQAAKRLACIVMMILPLHAISTTAQLIEQNLTLDVSGCLGYPFELPETRSQNDELLRICLNDNILTITGHQFIACDGAKLDVKVKRSGNILWLENHIVITGDLSDCMCLVDFTATLSELLHEGEYHLITKDGIFDLSLKNNISLSLTHSDINKDLFALRNDVEWVYYNAGINNESPNFIRMRLFEGEDDSFTVKYCVNSEQFEQAIPCGEIRPAVDLPEGTIPTVFLYLRSLEDNHLIYGDAYLDPSYNQFNSLQELNNEIWFEDNTEFGVIAVGESRVSVFDLKGHKVAEQLGSDKVTIKREQLDTGVYIVKCTGPQVQLTRKIII